MDGRRRERERGEQKKINVINYPSSFFDSPSMEEVTNMNSSSDIALAMWLLRPAKNSRPVRISYNVMHINTSTAAHRGLMIFIAFLIIVSLHCQPAQHLLLLHDSHYYYCPFDSMANRCQSSTTTGWQW